MLAPAPREGDSLFCKSASFVQRAWDNTSLSMLKECPAKYKLAIIDGWGSKITAAPLEFGSLFHAGLETFDRAVAAGASRQEATRSAIRFCLISTLFKKAQIRDGAGELLWESELVPISTPKYPIPEDLLSETGSLSPELTLIEQILPWEGLKQRTRGNLIRTIVWYLEHFKDDAAKTIILSSGQPAVELSFRLELPLRTPDGDAYLYCGHIDKAVTFGGQNFVLERKHTTYTLSSDYFKRYSPDGQVSGYDVAAQAVSSLSFAGVIIDAAQVATDFSRFARGIAPRTPAILNEWLRNTLYWIEQAEYYAKRQFWPMNETACHKYSGCQFRDVCGKDPAVRETFLSSNFVKRPWNPLANRGDSIE